MKGASGVVVVVASGTRGGSAQVTLVVMPCGEIAEGVITPLKLPRLFMMIVPRGGSERSYSRRVSSVLVGGAISRLCLKYQLIAFLRLSPKGATSKTGRLLAPLSAGENTNHKPTQKQRSTSPTTPPLSTSGSTETPARRPRLRTRRCRRADGPGPRRLCSRCARARSGPRNSRCKQRRVTPARSTHLPNPPLSPSTSVRSSISTSARRASSRAT